MSDCPADDTSMPAFLHAGDQLQRFNSARVYSNMFANASRAQCRAGVQEKLEWLMTSYIGLELRMQTDDHITG